MDYFAGLDISMDETHICVLDREGEVVTRARRRRRRERWLTHWRERRVVVGSYSKQVEWARSYSTGSANRVFPVVCVESRQAYQALKPLATHKTDRNDARGLAHLARTGFFKRVHVKSLPAHAIRSLISARKKLVGQRVTLKIRSVVSRSCSGSDCSARSPPPSSTTLLDQARGSPVCLPPCGV
jgi:transposase